MKAGPLNRRIALWRYTQTGTSEFNEPIFTWSVVMANMPANVKPLTADERFGSDQVFAVRTMAFTTRWFDGLTTEDVIAFDGGHYDITGIAEIGRHGGYEITAKWREGALEGSP
jgi:SPP1 family predicted phage head-tail adaptor